MDIRRIRKPINKFLRAIPKDIQVDEVIIFGSYLHGEATKDSDIDVIVVSDNFQKWNEDRRLDVLYKASRFIEPEIHPWGFTGKELQKYSQLTYLGDARIHGYRYPH